MAKFGMILEWEEVFAYLGVGLWMVTVLLYAVSKFLQRSGKFLFPSLNENAIELQIKRVSNTQRVIRIAVIYMTIRMKFTLALFNEITPELLMALLAVLPGFFIVQGLMKLSR